MVQHRPGVPAEVLGVETRPIPVPHQGELLVELAMAPVNPSDLLSVRGTYGVPTAMPRVPGFEGVGRVLAAGPDTPGPPVGCRVLALRGSGTWASHAVIPAATAIRVPDGIDDATAAQLWINPLTAWLLLTAELAAAPGEIIVANAAASAFGRSLCSLARHLGVQVVAVTRSPVHHRQLLDFGAAAVVDESGGDATAAVARFTAGRPVRAVLDAVGGASAASLMRCLPDGGTLRYYARLSGAPIAADPTTVARYDVAGFWLRRWVAAIDDAGWHRAFGGLMDAVLACGLRLPVAASFPLEQVGAAVAAAEARDKPGKVLLDCSA